MLTLAQKLRAHEGFGWNSAWSPDGSLLASCGQDRRIRVWRLVDKELVSMTVDSRSDEIHSRTIRRVAWRGDSKLLAAVSFDSTISLWYVTSSLTELRFLTKLTGQESEVKGVSFSPCGDMLATCSRDKSIWIFDIAEVRIPGMSSTITGTSLGDFQAVPSAPEISLEPESEGGEFMIPAVSPSHKNDIDCLAVLQGHSQDVKSVQFSPHDSSLLVSVSYDDSVRIWSSSDQTGVSDDWICASTLKATQGGHSNTVWDIKFNPSSPDEFITVGADGAMKLWSRKNPMNKLGSSWFLAGGPLNRSIHQRSTPVSPTTNSPWTCISSIQVVVSNDTSIPVPPLYSVDWSKDGRFIALACGDNYVRIFLRTSLSLVQISCVKTEYEPNSVSWTPDGIMLSVVCDDGSLLIYDFHPNLI